jgi:hypothetical protein
MHFTGFLRFTFSIGVWMLGAASIPISLTLAAYKIYKPLYVIVSYYLLRTIFPAKHWPIVLQILNLNAAPYCNSQTIVFEKGAAPPKPNSKTMIALSPHGILTIGWMMTVSPSPDSLLSILNSSLQISSKEFIPSECKWLVAEILSKLPFISDLNTWGNIVSCGKSDMISYLSQGINVGLIPGGFEEASIYQRNHHRVYLRARKGFIKYALQFGYQVQPLYVFGEELTYWQYNFPKSIALWLNKYKIPATLFIGKYLFLPDNNIDITVVVGKPIPLPQIESPSNEEVDKYHEIYLKEMEGIFERNKEKYGVSKEVKLEIL